MTDIYDHPKRQYGRGTHYIWQTAAACMPASCKGRYGRVAVLEVLIGVNHVGRISEHDSEVVSVVATWERQNIGTTEKCAFERSIAAAQDMVTELMGGVS